MTVLMTWHLIVIAVAAGKSAGLILRRMNAAALAEARCLLVEQVTQGLARLSLLQSLGTLSNDADPRYSTCCPQIYSGPDAQRHKRCGLYAGSEQILT